MSLEGLDVSRKVDQTQYSDKMPEYPGRVLVTHIAVKGLQAGSLLGLALTPVISIIRKKPFGATWRGLMIPFSILGVVASTGTLYYKHTLGDLSIPGVDDRAYRIVKNERQTKVDKYSLIGASTGGVLGALSGAGVLTLAATGVALGSVYFVAEKQLDLEQYYPKEKLVDLDGIKGQIDKLLGKK